ncbi:MAG: hypothetical protein HYT13_00045 [Candidatus Liptonbacteria bacterium]|nr:hypothetical protein [Candidatus Liptonbacteria bacterium]
MSRFKNFVWEVGLLTATTIGAGVFAIPYIFSKSGWLLSILYIGLISSLIFSVHLLYWQVLAKAGDRVKLLGLIKKYFGQAGYYSAFLIIIGGLILTLVVYLILAREFIALIMPSAGIREFILFWLISSLPIILSLRRLISLELLGAVFMGGIILFIFFTAPTYGILERVPAFNFKNILLPFSPIIFALAAWTAVEPIYEYAKKTKSLGARPAPDKGEARPTLVGRPPARALLFGTFLAALLYIIFAFAILGSTETITPDAISGLQGWPSWKLGILGSLGLFAIWTSYVPIGLEIKSSLEERGWSKNLSFSLVLFLPITLLLLGLNNFLAVVSLVGGVFLGLQYWLIVSLGQRVLSLPRGGKIFLNFLATVFVLAAVYEIYQFILK